MTGFSDREQKIIKIIGKRHLTLEQISSKLFNEGDEPFESSITVGNSVRRIIRKCEHLDLGWTLIKTRVNKKLTISKEVL